MVFNCYFTNTRTRAASFIGKCCLLLVALSFSFGAMATDYYVDPSRGNDRNDGSMNRPWKTIGKANGVLRAGDIVYLRGGTYSGQQIRPSRSGTSSNPVTYKAYGNEKPVITNVGTGISLSGVSWIRIDGIEVNGRGHWTSASVGTWIEMSNADRCTIINSVFKHAKGWSGVSIDNGSDYNHFKGNYFYDCGTWRKSDGNDAGDLFMLKCGDYNLIEENEFYRGGHVLMTLYGSHNVVRNNLMDNDYGIRDGKPAGGRVLDIGNNDKYSCSGVAGGFNVVEHNIIKNAWAAGDDAHTQLTKVQGVSNIVRYNYMLNCGGGEATSGANRRPVGTIAKNRVYNNTIHNIGASAIRLRYDNDGIKMDDNQWKNNIIARTGFNPRSSSLRSFFNLALDRNGSNSFHDTKIIGNLFWDNPNGNNGFVSGVGTRDITWFENNHPQHVNKNIISNPGFVSPARNSSAKKSDFYLKQGSPAIDAGVHLSHTASSGSGTDIRIRDVFYFSDGKGMVPGDQVVIGKNVPVRITNVDYRAGTITVSRAISWSEGEPVNLPYKGSAPDIGAYESQGTDNTPVNNPPEVQLTNPANGQSFQQGQNVELVAIATDLDGSIKQVVFYVDGNRIDQIADAPYVRTWKNLPAGSFELTAEAEDDSGAKSVSAPVKITVEGITQSAPPSVSATGAELVLPANYTTVSAEGSDPDGGTVSFAWSQKSGPAQAKIEGGTSERATISEMVEGEYIFTVTVTDDEGEVATADAFVKVHPEVIQPAPAPPAGSTDFWLEAECATVGSGMSVVEDASASGGSVVMPGSGNDWDAPAADQQIAFNFEVSQAGSYKLFALVDHPAHSDDSWWVSVNGGQWYPWRKELTNGLEWLQVREGDHNSSFLSLNLQAGANTVVFGRRKDGVKLDKIYITLSGNAPSGTGEAASNCTAIPNELPVADAGADAEITLPESSVTLSGGGSDPDGGTVSYTWSQVSGPSTATLAGADGATATASSLQEGSYVFELLIADDEGSTASDQVTVKVNAAVTPPSTGGSSSTDFWLEAECATVGSGMRVVENNTASGGSYVEPASGSDWRSPAEDQQIAFTINVAEAAQYKVFARVNFGAGGDDSFWLKANDGNWINWNSRTRTSGFEWLQPVDADRNDAVVIFNLQAGENTIYVGRREDGTAIDKLYLTLNSDAPTGTGETASNCGTAAEAFAITSPADGSTGETRQSITISTNSTATGGKTDGKALVEFFVNGIKIGEATEEPYEIEWSTLTPGRHVITARRTYLAIVEEAQPVIIKLDKHHNLVPNLNVLSPAAGAGFDHGQSVVLAADAEDVDGSVKKMLFVNNQTGELIAESTAAPFEFYWESLSPGNYNVEMLAIDNENDTTSKSVNFVVLKGRSSNPALVDKDGNPLEEVAAEDGTPIEVTYGPNPVDSFVMLKVDHPSSGEVNIRIFDIQGREVLNQKVIKQGPASEVEINTGTFDRGLYFIEILFNNQSKMIKILKH